MTKSESAAGAPIGVLIVTHNSAETIGACLRSLQAQLAAGDSVVVVDNASTDATVGLVRSSFPGVRIVQSENIGFGAGMNLARRHTAAEWLLVLNPDTVVLEGCLAALRAQGFRDAIMAPMQLDERGIEIGAGRAADVFGYPVERQHSANVFYADGAAIYIAAVLFDTLGGFDERGFLFCEDVDLSWRAWLRGYSVLAVPQARITHYRGASIAGGKDVDGRRVTSVRRRYYTEYNLLRHLIRHYSWATNCIILPLYFALLAAEIAVHALSRNQEMAKVLAQAVVANIRELPTTLSEHACLQASRAVSDMTILRRLYWGSGKVLLFLDVGTPEFVD